MRDRALNLERHTCIECGRFSYGLLGCRHGVAKKNRVVGYRSGLSNKSRADSRSRIPNVLLGEWIHAVLPRLDIQEIFIGTMRP